MGTGVQFTIKAIDQASSILNKINFSLKGLTTGIVAHFKNVFGSLASHLALLSGINTAALVATTGLLAKNAVSLASDYESANMAFTTFLGSRQKAESFLTTLQDFANVTPFEFPQLVASTQQMLAMGFQANQLIPVLTALGDATAGLGGSPEKLERMTLTLGTIMSRGFFSGMEARELAIAGVNAHQMIGDYIGKSTQDVLKLQEQGKLSAAMSIEALRIGMEKKFPNMMQNMSGMWKGLVSTIHDTWNMGLRKMGETAIPMLEGLGRGIINVLNNIFTDENMKKLSDKLTKIFSRENVLNIVTWFANIYEWGKFVFGKLGEFAPKAINFITDALKNMKNFILNDLIPVLFKVTQVIVALESIKLGLNIANAAAHIAAMIPNPVAAAAVLAGGIGLGAQTAMWGSAIGIEGLNWAGNQYDKWNKKRQKREALEASGVKPEVNPWAFPKLGAGALSQNAQDNVNTFMSGFDKTFKPLLAPAQQTAAGINELVNQGNDLKAALLGNAGERTKMYANRARFGNIPRGGGIQVNITVADQKSANNLRYLVQQMAAGG